MYAFKTIPPKEFEESVERLERKSAELVKTILAFYKIKYGKQSQKNLLPITGDIVEDAIDFIENIQYLSK